MSKTILYVAAQSVAMVVACCITWWLVAGEAQQAFDQSGIAYQQAENAYQQASGGISLDEAYQLLNRAIRAHEIATSNFSTQG